MIDKDFFYLPDFIGSFFFIIFLHLLFVENQPDDEDDEEDTRGHTNNCTKYLAHSPDIYTPQKKDKNTQSCIRKNILTLNLTIMGYNLCPKK